MKLNISIPKPNRFPNLEERKCSDLIACAENFSATEGSKIRKPHGLTFTICKRRFLRKPIRDQYKSVLLFVSLIVFSTFAIAQTKISTADYDIYILDTLLLDVSQMEILPTLDPAVQKTLQYKPKTDGFRTYHFVSGFKCSEGQITGKKRVGEWMSWYDSGKVSNTIQYVKGIRSGICKYWYKNGKLNATGQYLNDLKNGEWLIYNSDGTYKGKFIYVKGVLLK